MKEIIVDENNQYYSSEYVAFYLINQRQELILYPSGKKNSIYTVPQSIMRIEYGAFLLAEQLEEIKVESGNDMYYAENGVLFERSGQRESHSIFPDSIPGVQDTLELGISLHTFPSGKMLDSYTIQTM